MTVWISDSDGSWLIHASFHVWLMLTALVKGGATTYEPAACVITRVAVRIRQFGADHSLGWTFLGFYLMSYISPLLLYRNIIVRYHMRATCSSFQAPYVFPFIALLVSLWLICLDRHGSFVSCTYSLYRHLHYFQFSFFSFCQTELIAMISSAILRRHVAKYRSILNFSTIHSFFNSLASSLIGSKICRIGCSIIKLKLSSLNSKVNSCSQNNGMLCKQCNRKTWLLQIIVGWCYNNFPS